jgi:hypothetical protein
MLSFADEIRNREIRARARCYFDTCEYLSTRIRNWFRASAKRPRANSFVRTFERTKPRLILRRWSSVAVVSRRGRTARTAACFCVVLTLERRLLALQLLARRGFGAAFFVFTAALVSLQSSSRHSQLQPLRADGSWQRSSLALGLELTSL